MVAVERVPPHLAVPRVDPPWVQVAPAPVDLPARPTRMPLVRAGVCVTTVRGRSRARRRGVMRGMWEAEAPAEGDAEVEVAHPGGRVVGPLGRLEEAARPDVGRGLDVHLVLARQGREDAGPLVLVDELHELVLAFGLRLRE